MAKKSPVAAAVAASSPPRRAKPTTATAAEAREGYERFERAVAARVASLTGPLFTTDVDPDALWQHYLAGMPVARRQHYTCNCCRRFVQTYGGLARIDEAGNSLPAMWGNLDVPAFFGEPLTRMYLAVERAKVTGVFLSPDATWGTPLTGPWTHVHGTRPASEVYRHPTVTAFQAMAARAEDYGMVRRAIAEFPVEAARQAVRVLEADTLDRSEKTLGVARWFLALHEALDGVAERVAHNLAWRAVAAAPPGFCNVRSSMIGTLLEDVVAGVPFESIKRRWDEKMHPLRYQRPTAAPKAGTIDQANKLFDQLGLAPSLQRRFGTRDDVLAWVWRPPTAEQYLSGLRGGQKSGGTFDHLREPRPPAKRGLDVDGGVMTWEKFARTVLPSAIDLKVYLPSHGSFAALVTASDPTSPPLLQWDGLDGLPRNPASTYVYHNGSSAGKWGLMPGWSPVSGVYLHPSQWQDPSRFKHQNAGLYFAVPGAHDSTNRELAIFPDNVRSELHGVRSVIEAHSKRGSIHQLNPSQVADTASGYAFAPHTRVRVTTPGGGVATYTIDRLD